MNKILITLALAFTFSASLSQWTRVQQLPPSDIFTLFHKDSILYAGGTNVIYVSRNKGQTWDSTAAIPGLPPVGFFINNIVVFKNELYASVPLHGVFKSTDAGVTWQTINAGISSFATVHDFCEYRGDLYTATALHLGNTLFKLNPVGRSDWLGFSEGLNTSLAITSIIGNNNVLIAGTAVNALYNYLPAGDTVWQERFLLGQISPDERINDIVTAHDSLFLAGSSGRFYLSTDDGLNWTLTGNSTISNAATIVNAKQAILLSARNFDGVSLNTDFFYIKKDSHQNPFVRFSVFQNFFTYKMDIVGDKLWAAGDRGLFLMPLSDLPGITAADDSVAAGPLPVRFISFDATCQSNNVLLTWKIAQEQNSSRFDIERSFDGTHWSVIGSQQAAGNSTTEKTYSLTENNPSQNSFYRIAEFDLDGRIQYTATLRLSCNATDAFSVWPNPVHDRIFINIVSGNASRATVNIFDNMGALVKTQRATVLQGSNQLSIDIRSLPNGTYSLSAYWNNGQMKKEVQVLKQ